MQSDRRVKNISVTITIGVGGPLQDAPPLSTPTSTAITTLLRMRLIGHSCSEPLSRKCFHHRDCLHVERSACIAVDCAILDGLIELHTCPAQKVCDWIPYSRSKWRSRPQWSNILSSQCSSDGCICRISWFSIDAIRCHRCLPSCREQQAFDCAHGGR